MAQIFVAVLGTSSFTFARAGWTQALPDWIDAPRSKRIFVLPRMIGDVHRERQLRDKGAWVITIQNDLEIGYTWPT